MSLSLIGAMAGATALALAVYWVTGLVRGRSAAAIVAEYRGRSENALDGLGIWLAKRLPISLERIQNDIAWAQRAGELKDVTAQRILAEAVLWTAAGYLLLFLVAGVPKGLALLLPLVLTYYPVLRVRNRGNRARKQVRRQLPELAAIIAAELAAGASPDTALERASRFPGPLARFVAEAVEYARKVGRPLFSRPPVVGAFPEYARTHASDVPELVIFASQVDLVAQKGTQGAFLMNEVAQAMAREHRMDIMARVKRLDGQLVLAAAVFYFMPFVGFLLWVLGAPVLSMFASP